MLSAASTSLDHKKVSGAAIALSCDNSEPGTISMTERPGGAIATIASRKLQLPGAKQSGVDRSTRPRTADGSKAAKIAANVPPNAPS